MTLTRPHLLQLLCHLSTRNYNDRATRDAFSLAFAGFLRVGEFTYREADRHLGPTFSKWFLTQSCVRIQARGTHMQLTLPSSKTDPFRTGVKLTIAASHDTACPVRAMQQFLIRDTHQPQYSPLFCLGMVEHQAFTPEHVVHWL